MNVLGKRNLTVSERTLSLLYLFQGVFQQRLKKKVTLAETVDILMVNYAKNDSYLMHQKEFT